MFCKNCGVELENDMAACPLCGEPVNGVRNGPHNIDPVFDKQPYLPHALIRKQRKLTWEIVSLVLGSGVIAAFIVDFIISHSITWSEYTTAIGLLLFCYVSIFAFLNRNIILETAGGFFFSSICFLILDMITGGISWAIRLAIPLLLGINIIVVLYTIVIRSASYKGINLVAYAFLGAALLCLYTEGIISHFRSGIWHLNWSVIASACLVPVIMVMLFIHFRLRKARDLKRTFHI